MIDCDKVKEYISDYIEKNLSPNLRSELDSHFRVCEKCNVLLQRLPKIQSLMQNLNTIKCSDDFNLRLRNRIINNENDPLISKEIFRKTSYGLSFAMVVIFAVVGFNFFNGTESESGIISPQVQIQESNNPSDPLVNKTSSNLTQTEEMEVRTKDAEGIYSDSSKTNKPEEKDPRVKYVDSK